jgi:hypothetical protein
MGGVRVDQRAAWDASIGQSRRRASGSESFFLPLDRDRHSARWKKDSDPAVNLTPR